LTKDNNNRKLVADIKYNFTNYGLKSFLKNKIGFLDISKIIEKTLNETPTQNLDTLPSVVENDQLSRQLALSLISKND